MWSQTPNHGTRAALPGGFAERSVASEAASTIPYLEALCQYLAVLPRGPSDWSTAKRRWYERHCTAGGARQQRAVERPQSAEEGRPR